MTDPVYPRWANAVLYQGVWFVGVLGGVPWTPLAFAFVAAHLALVRWRASASFGRELLTVLLASAIGTATDTALTLGGVFVFTPEPTPLPIPIWLVAIWLGFATTFRHAIAFIMARPPLAIVAGAVGGPLSYLGAARLGAVTLPNGALATGLGLSLVWALLMAAFVALVRCTGVSRAVNASG